MDAMFHTAVLNVICIIPVRVVVVGGGGGGLRLERNTTS